MTILFKPELGLPMNPGGNACIQNAALGEEGHQWKIYRHITSGDFDDAPGIAVDDVLFTTEGFIEGEESDGAGLIDVSNVASVSLAVLVNYAGYTDIDIILKFCDLTQPAPFVEYQQTALVRTITTNVQLDVRPVIIRMPISLDNMPIIFTVPVYNAKFMRIFINGNAPGTPDPGRYAIILVGRGWQHGSGIISV